MVTEKKQFNNYKITNLLGDGVLLLGILLGHFVGVDIGLGSILDSKLLGF